MPRDNDLFSRGAGPARTAALFGAMLLITALAQSRKEAGAPALVSALPTGLRAPDDTASPSDLPARGWLRVFKGVFERFNKDRVMLVAAGVAFYVLLAIFPAIGALVSLYGLFADRGALKEQIGLLTGVMPEGALDIIREEVSRIADVPGGALSATFLFSLAISLWSANAGMKGFFESMNVVYEEDETRGFIGLNLRSLGFTFAAILFALVALFAVVAVPIVLRYVGLERSGELVLSLLRWPFLLGMLLVALAALYRYGPSRPPARWRWLTWGAAFAATLWLAASILFSWYVGNFGKYNATYGSLGAVIGFMTWIWISVIVTLIGGELNAQIERQARGNPA